MSDSTALTYGKIIGTRRNYNGILGTLLNKIRMPELYHADMVRKRKETKRKLNRKTNLCTLIYNITTIIPPVSFFVVLS